MKKVSRLITFILLVVLLFAGMSATYKSVIKNVNLGLDLQGGFEVLYQVNPLGDGEKIDNTAVQSTAKTLERRVNVLGVSEPKIQVEDQTESAFSRVQGYKTKTKRVKFCLHKRT